MNSNTPIIHAAVFRPNRGYEPCVSAEDYHKLELDRDEKDRALGLWIKRAADAESDFNKLRTALGCNAETVEVCLQAIESLRNKLGKGLLPVTDNPEEDDFYERAEASVENRK